jgi:hypothetical protein
MAASTQRKPTIVPEYESEFPRNVEEPVPPDVHISQSAQPSAGSTGLIIAALVVVLGILFVLSFDWSASTTAPSVTQNNSAPATPDALAPVTPIPATPPAAEATTPPATEVAPQPPATTTQ